MTQKEELELAYLRAMNDWMTQVHNTQMMVSQRNITGFTEQSKKEELAFEAYRRAQRAFINA